MWHRQAGRWRSVAFSRRPLHVSSLSKRRPCPGGGGSVSSTNTPRNTATTTKPLGHPQKRTYMDVHTRPSHSGMFPRPTIKLGESPSSQPPPPEEPPEALAFYSLLLSRAAMAAGFIYCVTEYVADITLCEGPSMMPTLRPSGEIVCIDKWTLRRYGVADGCRVTQRIKAALARQEAFEQESSSSSLNRQDGTDIWHERRVSVSDLDPPTWRDVWELLSSPLSVGDVVVVVHPNRHGTVCKRVRGLPGDTVLRPRAGLLVVPDGHVWLEGDNPVNSADSRNYGAIPLALVQGRVLFRVWPLRGEALLRRGAPPHQQVAGCTILPAGYEGQHILKHKRETDGGDK